MNETPYSKSNADDLPAGSLHRLIIDMLKLTQKLDSFHLSLILQWQRSNNQSKSHSTPEHTDQEQHHPPAPIHKEIPHAHP